MFSKLKYRDVTVFKRKNIRGFVGGLLGMAAGMSLTTTIIPTVVSSFVGAEHFLIRFALAGYFAHTALIWAATGFFAARPGRNLPGMLIMGLTGGLSGLLLALVCLDSDSKVLFASVFGSLVYGTVGGLIISGILPGDDERLMFNLDKKKTESSDSPNP